MQILHRQIQRHKITCSCWKHGSRQESGIDTTCSLDLLAAWSYSSQPIIPPRQTGQVSQTSLPVTGKQRKMWPFGLVVWFSFWVREVPGSIPGTAHSFWPFATLETLVCLCLFCNALSLSQCCEFEEEFFTNINTNQCTKVQEAL